MGNAHNSDNIPFEMWMIAFFSLFAVSFAGTMLIASVWHYDNILVLGLLFTPWTLYIAASLADMALYECVENRRYIYEIIKPKIMCILFISAMAIYAIYFTGVYLRMNGFIINHWAALSGIATLILVALRYIFSELSRYREAAHFGIDVRLTYFRLRDVASRSLEALLPLVLSAALPITLSYAVNPTERWIAVTMSMFSALTIGAGHYIIVKGLMSGFWDRIKIFEPSATREKRKKRNIFIMLLHMIVATSVSAAYFIAFPFEQNGFGITNDSIIGIASAIIPVHIAIIFLISAALSFKESTSGYHAGRKLNDLLLTNHLGKCYFVAARHDADKWVLMRCTGNVLAKSVEVHKGQYLIKSLDGHHVCVKRGYEIRIHDERVKKIKIKKMANCKYIK